MRNRKLKQYNINQSNNPKVMMRKEKRAGAVLNPRTMEGSFLGHSKNNGILAQLGLKILTIYLISLTQRWSS
jgi:hypothetical protein